MSATNPALNSLAATASHLLSQSVAPSTKGKYTSRVNIYVHFCTSFNLQQFPVIQNNLILFATHLSSSTSHKTIKGYLSAIKYVADIQGCTFTFDSYTQLYRLLRGIKRAQGNSFKKPPRQPIFPSLLQALGTKLWLSSIRYEDKVMLWAAMLTAFFGFLRVSEYTSNLVKSFDPDTTLCFRDVTLDAPSNTITIKIKASKTDPFHKGVSITLCRNYSTLCPVEALSSFLHSHPTRAGPLFTWHDGRFLTRKHVNSILNRIKPEGMTDMSSHSFRIGAASTAAAAGFPRWLIQALGRWSSNCYKDYIRIPNNTLSNVSFSLASTFTSGPTYDPDNFAPAL